jgi:hypothetical protein
MHRRRSRPRRRRPLLAAALLLTAAGCSTPNARLAAAADAFASTVEVLAAHRQAGRIDEASAERVGTAVEAGHATLIAWREAIEAGEPVSGHAERFNRILDELITERAAAEARAAEGRRP